MKSVTELGLELIELEDQVLLVDKKSKGGKFYYVDNSLGKRIETAETRPSGDVFEIIASTKPLEGLPSLVIEDEVDENIKNRNFYKQIMNPYPIESYSYTAYEKGFIEGYNKSTEFYSNLKETYKFTEEDFREAVCEAWNSCEDNEDEETFTQVFNRIIQSLTKKELWLEVEYFYHSSKEFYGDEADWVKCDESQYNSIRSEIPKCPLKVELKVTNNQIKGIWK